MSISLSSGDMAPGAETVGVGAGLPSSVSHLAPLSPAPTKYRISDRVYEQLISSIRDLGLPPNAVLSETELSARLGVSRTPLREAISRLADQGLVLVVPQVGTRVAPIDLDAVSEACFVRSALESSAFRIACERADSDVSTLRRILREQERSLETENTEGFFRTDEALHQEIFRLSGHAGAWNVVLRSKLQLDRLRRLILPDAISSRALLDEHTRIVDLLEAGDSAAGADLIGVHSTHVLRQAPHVAAEYPAYFLS